MCVGVGTRYVSTGKYVNGRDSSFSHIARSTYVRESGTCQESDTASRREKEK